MNGESVDTAIDFEINDTDDLHYLYSEDKVLPRPVMYWMNVALSCYYRRVDVDCSTERVVS